MSKAFFLPFAVGKSVLPPRYGPLTKEDALKNQLRTRRLEDAISKLRTEKEMLRMEAGEYPVLHIPEERSLS